MQIGVALQGRRRNLRIEFDIAAACHPDPSHKFLGATIALAFCLKEERLPFAVLLRQLPPLDHYVLHQEPFYLLFGVLELLLCFFLLLHLLLSFLPCSLLLLFQFLDLSFQFFCSRYFFLMPIFISLALQPILVCIDKNTGKEVLTSSFILSFWFVNRVQIFSTCSDLRR